LVSERAHASTVSSAAAFCSSRAAERPPVAVHRLEVVDRSQVVAQLGPADLDDQRGRLQQVWGDAAARFKLWAEQTSRWWPHRHSVSGAPGLAVTFEPRPGGRIFERTPSGAEHEWGEVLIWDPPRRLV